MADSSLPRANWGVIGADEYAPDFTNIDTESKEAQEKERYRQDTKHRDYLVRWVVYTNSAWLMAILVIVIAHGAVNEDGSDLFHLSDTVMVTLLATTTANVLGLALIVLRGLFNSPKETH